MRIKICGITREADGILASSLGAWALGFIFYQKSPRYIEPHRAKAIIDTVRQQADSPPKMVGVFVNSPEDQVRQIQKELALELLQFHGDEGPQVLNQFPGHIRAVRLHPEGMAELQNLPDSMSYLLVDAAVKGHYGGTGTLSDWSLAKEAKSVGKPLILSGGLNASNILQAWTELAPFALDLSSGVEEEFGIKSHEKLRELFKIKEVFDAGPT